MRTSVIVACAAVAVLLGAAAVHAADYSCPSTCQAKLGCQCASSSPPGGLANGDIPQFIVLTNDDAITVVSQPVILNVTERHSNKNGCKMPATWFVSIQYTDPNLVKQVYARGHEIATHTVDHVANPNATEILGARDWLNKTAGIPLEKIGGFRAPFLVFDPEQRDILSKNGFLYDSSISEQYPSTTSPSAGQRLWPYTMDYGVPQNCAISTGTCSVSESHPGLWEFPMWNVQDQSGTVVSSMDPQGDAFELYKLQFDQRYNGNRAPLGIFIHAAWIIADPTRADKLDQFLEYAMSKDDVFLVTIQQVIEWMKNPVPASQYNPTCPSDAEIAAALPQGGLCVIPNDGCVYGTFDSSSCKCVCQNEDINAAGYCRDPATGSCTVQKSYDFTNKDYYCPDASAPAAAPTSSTSTPGGDSSAATSGAKAVTVEMDVSGSSPADFQAMHGADLCAQLLRLTGDATATCAIVSVTAATGRRLLQDKVHVVAVITTQNAQATASALQSDATYTLLAPAGIAVVPGSVKASLGTSTVPAPAPATSTATTAPSATEGSSSSADGSSSSSSSADASSSSADASSSSASSTTDSSGSAGSTESGSSGGSSNTGAIVGAVVGALAGLAILGGGAFWYMRRRRSAAATSAAINARTNSYNPAFAHSSGVTATVSTSHSPTKKQLAEAQ